MVFGIEDWHRHCELGISQLNFRIQGLLDTLWERNHRKYSEHQMYIGAFNTNNTRSKLCEMSKSIFVVVWCLWHFQHCCFYLCPSFFAKPDLKKLFRRCCRCCLSHKHAILQIWSIYLWIAQVGVISMLVEVYSNACENLSPPCIWLYGKANHQVLNFRWFNRMF